MEISRYGRAERGEGMEGGGDSDSSDARKMSGGDALV
jgi:hypothetical protein